MISSGQKVYDLLYFSQEVMTLTFSEKLKELRTKKNYSQESLAELLNVSRQAITKWENGNGMPDIENLKAIAQLFGVTVDSLVHDEIELNESNKSDGLCWISASVGLVLGLLAGYVFQNEGMSLALWGIGGGLIGYGMTYVILLIKVKR